MDIAVFPSTFEPCSIVAPEGMVAGIPVVASNNGGFAKILNLKEEINLLLIAITEILINECLSSKIGKFEKQKVHKLYNWNNNTYNFEEI